MLARQTFAILLTLAAFRVSVARVAAQSESSSSAAHAQLAITLRPMPGADGKVATVDVALELNGLHPEAGKRFSLRIPVEFAGVKHVADRIENLEVRSDDGPVKLEQVDEPPDAGGSLFWRRWELPLPTAAQFKAHYRARLDPPHPWPGPPFDLRSNGGGVSGAGFGFLVLPDSKEDFDITLRWDLRDMPAGAKGVASVGEGDVHFAGPVSRLQECFYLAGPVGAYPENLAASPFRSAWLGTPPFDPRTEMQWSEKAYLALREFFAEKTSTPFYFFMRAGRDNESYGGAALANSFLLFAPEAGTVPNDDPPRLIIAHEMTHHFAGGLSLPDGIEGSWFSEGLAEYYSRWISFRAGLIPPAAFAKAVNGAAQAYYANPLRNLPNEKIAEGFWRDKNVQGLPYQRGFFYFVDTNQKLLAASGGKVSLDSVLLPQLSRRNNGEQLTPETWKQAMEKELGAAGGEEFEAVIVKGDVAVPASDAFGPCFERHTVQMGIHELGFDQHKTMDIQPRTVQGLVAGSAAEKAGLRNGDAVLAVDPRNVDDLRTDVTKRIHLRIKRGEQTLEVEYLPRGQPVEGYQWLRRSGVTDEACATRP